MPAKSQPNPIIPGSTQDRTGTVGILRRAYATIRARFAACQKDVLAIFERIPRYALNDDRGPAVAYGIPPEQLANIAQELQDTLQRWIGADRDPAHVLWWEPYQAEAAQLGAAQSVANLTRLSTVYAAARTLQQVVYSEPYRRRIEQAKFRGYTQWTGLAAEQRTKLAQVIGQAVADGLNPRAARKLIAEALDVGKARALLYGQTDILGTLREARWAEADAAAEEFNIRTALLWTSALKPTTRSWHASRSGRTFSTEEVRAFYADKGNRWNCFCSQTECLLDEDNKPILTKALQSAMANERKTWQSRYGKK